MSPRCLNCDFDLSGQLTQTGRVTCPECGIPQGVTDTADLLRRRSQRFFRAMLIPCIGYLAALICFFVNPDGAGALIVFTLLGSALACLSFIQTSDKPRLRWAQIAGYLGAWIVFQTACVIIVVAIFLLAGVLR